ncbi:hypothetical protein X975_21145, partial [Stegodyphus mimosarum]
MSQYRKEGRQVKKCKSATFQLDGFCYTIESLYVDGLQINCHVKIRLWITGRKIQKWSESKQTLTYIFRTE